MDSCNTGTMYMLYINNNNKIIQSYRACPACTPIIVFEKGKKILYTKNILYFNTVYTKILHPLDYFIALLLDPSVTFKNK